MTKPQALTLTIAVIVVALGAVTFGVLSGRSPKTTNDNNTPPSVTQNANVSSSTFTLDQYHLPHLTDAAAIQLKADIHTASKYATPTGTDYTLLNDCGTTDKLMLVRQLDAQRRVQLVNGVLPILRTPNPNGWTLAEALAYLDDPLLVCGVGSFYPIEATADYILWRVACSSGMLPEVNGTVDPEFVRCLQAEEVLDRSSLSP